jgi:hypothetical protein
LNRRMKRTAISPVLRNWAPVTPASRMRVLWSR